MDIQYISLPNGASIAYTRIYPAIIKTNKVIVFLHEALGSIGQWKKFPQTLCNELGATGLVYEREGYGNSSPLQKKRNSSYLEDYALEEMPQVIQQLLPSDEIILVGHSDGGSIALLFASKYTAQVKGVVTMAAHVFVEKETIAGIYPALKAYNEGKLNGLRKYHGDKTDAIFKAWSDTWLSKEYQKWNICDKIAQTIPSLIMQGDKDEYGTTKQLELIQKHVPKADILLLEGIHHQPHLENIELVVREIKEWYGKNIE